MVEHSGEKSAQFRKAALAYHEFPTPGKFAIRATKPLANQRDLALAYSPGVAEACREIRTDPETAARYTARANLVGVVTNGTAALGLGDIGPLASKPIMEGKAVLFKKFANIDVFDIELDERDPERMAEIIAAMEPTFGAINLEDIKAPECFAVEALCRARMKIPVFHDDQHGTAIVVGAAATNALRVVGKKFEDIRIVSTGGGAAGIACLDLLLQLGVRRANVTLVDRGGVVYVGREAGMTEQKAAYARDTSQRALDEAIAGADMFLGLSGPGVLTQSMAAAMADRPIIFALANPTPEIMPGDVQKVRPDAVIATGRSDYPNQVNNVLCFPFIFRGALDVGATVINDEMKLACVRALADLAHASSSDVVARAYRGEKLLFGAEYLIPKPFDPRLLAQIAPAVAKAAMDSGVARRPIKDIAAYGEQLDRFVYRSGFLMKSVFEAAKLVKRRVVFAEGEDERVLRTAQTVLEEKLEVPILVGRPRVIEARCERLGLAIRPGRDFEVCDPEDDPRYDEYWKTYHQITERRGVSPAAARHIIRTNTTAIAAIMVRRGEAGALVCGCYGQHRWHLKYVAAVLGKRRGVRTLAALSTLILPPGPLFISDAYVNADPTAEEIVDIALLAAEEVRHFGISPKLAFISHSNFGSIDTLSASKMRAAVALMDARRDVDFPYEGEMHADAALEPAIRAQVFPHSRLEGPANLLIMPNADAASAAVNALKIAGDALPVGPLMMGLDGIGHIVTSSITARGLFNVAAMAGS